MFNHIRRLLTAGWYWLTYPAYRLVKKSGLFDAKFYCDENRDVHASGLAPLAHYLTKGFVEQRRPSLLFDHTFYLHQCPWLLEKKENPLLHFLLTGRNQGYKPNVLFDSDFFAAKNPNSSNENSGLISFPFLEDILFQTLSPYFDPLFYTSRYPDAAQYSSSNKAAYSHFLRFGQKQNRQPSIYFDSDFYLDKAPGLREMGIDPLSHYYMFGIKEGKSPSPLFEPKFYRAKYQLGDNIDPFGHYLRHEQSCDRQPCSWFDPQFYRRTYLVDRQDLPLKHFLETGLRQKLSPNNLVHELADKPVISILVPVYNVDITHLNSCIRSVIYQSYPHWQLCLADDCSTNPEIRPLLNNWASTDPRIKVVFLSENSGISAATNAAAALAEGRYLAFLDNDDELAPEALQQFAMRINITPADLYYSDEDLIGADGRQYSIFRKPGFNGELLLCHNYITHCVLTKKALFDKVGGCRDELNGAQDLDLLLKLSEQADAIIHIPEILYHWRASKSSTSINHSEKHYADEAGRKSVAQAFDRRGIPGKVHFTDWKFFYRAQRTIISELPVTIIVNWERPEDGLLDWLENLLSSAGYNVTQVILLVAQQPSATLLNACKHLPPDETLCHFSPDHLETAAKIQAISADIQGELVACISGNLYNFSDNWLSALVEYGQLPEVGLVGGKIEYTEHESTTVTPLADCTNTAAEYYLRFFTDCSVLMNGRQCPQEVRSVAGELFLVRRQLLLTQDDFSWSTFPLLFAFADFSLHLHNQGKMNIFTPYCRAGKRTPCHPPCPNITESDLQKEKIRFQDKWRNRLLAGDPFYNDGIVYDSNLSIDEFRLWLSGHQPSSGCQGNL